MTADTGGLDQVWIIGATMTGAAILNAWYQYIICEPRFPRAMTTLTGHRGVAVMGKLGFWKPYSGYTNRLDNPIDLVTFGLAFY